MIANLSAFQIAPGCQSGGGGLRAGRNVVQHDRVHGVLYPMDSNHGEFDRVTAHGAFSRVSTLA